MNLRVATRSDAGTLLPLVRAYHEFEGIASTDSEVLETIKPLLGERSNPGRIWLIDVSDRTVGYIALCFGYSIEFGGRDAFIDEFFIVEAARGSGIGRKALKSIRLKAVDLGIRVLHLEVARTNARAKRFYESMGFTSREHFHLMSCRM